MMNFDSHELWRDADSNLTKNIKREIGDEIWNSYLNKNNYMEETLQLTLKLSW
jgi:hypothetical protein